MSKEIEIEFKTRLKAEDFYIIKNALPFSKVAVIQTNHYFETEDMQLANHECALRIREINDKYTLTLKQPLEEGLLETHDNLSKSDFLQWKNNQHPIGDEVEIALKEIGILLSDLKYYGKLKTERYLYKRNGLEYVLDYSQYLGKEDYELEVEAETYQKGENAFTDLTEKFNIEQQMPISKIERFMTQLNKA